MRARPITILKRVDEYSSMPPNEPAHHEGKIISASARRKYEQEEQCISELHQLRISSDFNNERESFSAEYPNFTTEIRNPNAGYINEGSIYHEMMSSNAKYERQTTKPLLASKNEHSSFYPAEQVIRESETANISSSLPIPEMLRRTELVADAKTDFLKSLSSQKNALMHFRPRPSILTLSDFLESDGKKRTESKLNTKQDKQKSFQRLGYNKDIDKKPGIQRINPRKKKLSSLKKRLLKDRVQVWEELLGISDKTSGTVGELEMMVNDARIICISGMVSNDELEDDDEYNEIYNDVKDLVTACGPITSLSIPRNNEQGVGSIFVEYCSEVDARKAEINLNGRVIGGSVLKVKLGSELNCDYMSASCKLNSGKIICVKNLVRASDIEDEDEYNEIMDNISSMAGRFGSITAIFMDKQLNDVNVNVLIEFSDDKVADNAISNLNGTTICGEIIQVSALSSHVPVVVQVEYNVQQGENVDDLKKELIKSASKYGLISKVIECSNSIYFEYKSHISSLEAKLGMSAMVLEGISLQTKLVNWSDIPVTSSVTTSQLDNEQKLILTKKYMESVKIQTESDKLKKIPDSYKYAVQIPNLALDFNIQSQPYARDYIPNPEIDTIVTEMLKKLFYFQERAREMNPSKSKLKRRLTIGMHETLRGTKISTIKMIILAPNIDTVKGTLKAEENILGEKISEILTEAEENKIQVVFALNKRKIGKALGKKIKVSVVGIYNFEGAMEEKRNLDQLLAKNYSSGANCNYQT